MEVGDSLLVLFTEVFWEDYDDLMQLYLPSFPIEFQERIHRYRLKEDRLLTLAGRKLLRKGFQLLNVNADVFELQYNTWGMPYLNGNQVKFSISHSHKVSICAFAKQGEIGIDIEYWNEIHVANFKNVLCNNEWNEIQAAPNKMEAFYNCWTKKEAVLKAHGVGLNIPITSIKLQDQSAKVFNKQYYLNEVKIFPNYSCHLAASALPCLGLNIYEIKNADIKNAGAQLLKK
jgi:4'-phosphopantetheinyl transferase